MTQLVNSMHLIGPDTEALLDMLGSVIEGRVASYVSVPISTGWRFVEWATTFPGAVSRGTPEEDGEYRRQVIEPNRGAARILSSAPSVIHCPISSLIQPPYATFRDGLRLTTTHCGPK